MPRLNSMRLIHLPKISALLLLAFITLALSGCFLNDDDDDPAAVVDADPTGYYTNNGFASVDDGASGTIADLDDLQGLVSPDGILMMLSVKTGVAYVGSYTVNGNSLGGRVDVYDAGVMIEKDVPIINGQITPGSKITGELDGSGRAASGSFTLVYAGGMDNEPVELDMVYYNLDWMPVNNSENFYITLEEEALPLPNFGSGGSGQGVFDNCWFRGRIEPVPNSHLYTLSGVMKGCENSNSLSNGILDPDAYSGLVSVRGTAPNDRLIVVLTNGSHGIIGEYSRFF